MTPQQIEALKLALEALENNKPTHRYCEDIWYSCPKHEDGCADEREGDECNCGADEINAEFDKAITALKEALSDHAMQEVQRLGQEIEPDDIASILACRDMLDAQPVPPRTWVGLTDEDMYVVSEEESCSFIAGAKWSEAILKEKNT